MTLHGALELRAALDRDRLVNDVALDACRRGKANLEAAQATDHPTMGDDFIGDHLTLDRGGFTDDQCLGANIAFDIAFDLNVAARADIAGDRDVGGEDRGRWLGFLGSRARDRGAAEVAVSLGLGGVVVSGISLNCGPDSVVRVLENILGSLQVRHGVHGVSVQANFVMQMYARTTPGLNP